MAGPIGAPLIVTAELGPEDLAMFDKLRRKHYPPERNQVPAHLTLFHALPPSAEGEVRRLLANLAAGRAPKAYIAAVMNLGGGVAFRIASGGLDDIRAEIAERLSGLLTAQDSAGWSAHVTIQNKVEPGVARELIRSLGEDYLRRSVRISGLALHRYLGGPWENMRVYAFRG